MSQELKDLMFQQNIDIEHLEYCISNGKKRNLDKRNETFYKNRMEMLKEYWSEFKKRNMEIRLRMKNMTQDDLKGIQFQDKYEVVEGKFAEYMEELTEGLEKLIKVSERLKRDAETPLSQSQSQNVNITLPKINLPTFSGNYGEWATFRDLFSSIIHNNKEMPDVQKLQYLKGCLSGEAERLIKYIPTTNADYLPAWEKLSNRYENKRLLINHQLNKLLNRTKVNMESSSHLRAFVDNTEDSLQQLKTLLVDRDTIIIHILLSQLPFNTIKLWEEKLGDSQILPSLKDFTEFLASRARVLESVQTTVTSNSKSFHQVKTYLINTPEVKGTCPACNEAHYILRCPKFTGATSKEKKEIVMKSQLCFNCLGRHRANKCPNAFRCKVCSRKHHTLLHETFNQTNVNANQESSETAQNSNTFFSEGESSLLATAMVGIYKDKKKFMFNCLLDSGSQSSFITKHAAKKLKLATMPTAIEVSTLNGHRNTKINSKSSVNIEPHFNTTEKLPIQVLIIDHITNSLPTKLISSHKTWSHIEGLQLADPHFWEPKPIDILLGATVYAKILKSGIRKGDENTPVAINTMLGWILLGSNTDEDLIHVHLGIPDSDCTLNKTLKTFWETEEVNGDPIMSMEEKRCESFYQETTTRLASGQYQVRLPFVEKPILGCSKETTYKRFQYLMKKLNNDSILKEEYSKCLNEYIYLDQMEPNQTQNKGYFIPHHAVFKESSTTKLRPVFDASAKTSSGRSLNDYLMTGPTIQPKLFATLLKWRKYKIALTGDIEKMYRMIAVHPEDRQFQKVFWMDPVKNQVQEYQLKTVTFGTKSAPFLAIRTLFQLAEDEKLSYPLAAQKTKQDFYVDDLLTGADSISEAIELRDQYIQMLKSGNFNLRKWASNEMKALAGLDDKDIELPESRFFDETTSIKTLGIKWMVKSDTFTFKTTMKNFDVADTKRKILSEIATLYDPLGWISPVIIVAKVFMQELWLSGCKWDATLNPQIQEKWTQFKTQLSGLEKISIPRWIGVTKYTSKIQIHGFCDASIQAYAAVIYVCVYEEEKVKSVLLTSKTKVTPIKPVTIPRLELSGAVLLTRLLKQTIQDIHLEQKPEICLWTDSTIVLHWIKSYPNRWKTFVANRVAEIQETTNPCQWRHVPTKGNPADLASRGLRTEELIKSSLWWNGPEWITKPESMWPPDIIIQNPIELEAKTKVMVVHAAVENTMDILSRYSSFAKLRNVMAVTLRFVYNCQHGQNKMTGDLTLQELRASSNKIFQLVQTQEFSSEIKQISRRQQLSKQSPLTQLNPFIDNQGVLRVGGRLENANIPFNQKHPVILPASHHVTDLVIQQTHIETLHGGTTLMMNTLRQNTWIINARRNISKFVNKCPTCIRHRQQTRVQLMGNLPSARTFTGKPFTKVGIDYAGPFNVKTSKIRNAKTTKGYLSIFICMTTKAVHLEFVSDLSTEAFLAAFRRFTSRRGLCTDVYSDNGTNFQGANQYLTKEVKRAIKQATNEAAKITLQSNQITWHFNPAVSPHWGGLWEAGVKSVKYHLKRVMRNLKYTFEEYVTMLTQIEAVLNSRPLCVIGDKDEPNDVLTPGHFLIGQALNQIPEPSVNEMNLKNHWKHIQSLVQYFWVRWSKEYLHYLQTRPKWQHTKENLKINDIVLIKDEKTPAAQWPLGRIVSTPTGNDGLVRVVDVKTGTAIYSRPIVKIIKLVNSETQD